MTALSLPEEILSRWVCHQPEYPSTIQLQVSFLEGFQLLPTRKIKNRWDLLPIIAPSSFICIHTSQRAGRIRVLTVLLLQFLIPPKSQRVKFLPACLSWVVDNRHPRTTESLRRAHRSLFRHSEPGGAPNNSDSYATSIISRSTFPLRRSVEQASPGDCFRMESGGMYEMAPCRHSGSTRRGVPIKPMVR